MRSTVSMAILQTNAVNPDDRIPVGPFRGINYTKSPKYVI